MCCFSWVWCRARRGQSLADWFLVLWWLLVVKWMIAPQKMLPKKWKNVLQVQMETTKLLPRLLAKVSFCGHALKLCNDRSNKSRIYFLVIVMSARSNANAVMWPLLKSCDPWISSYSLDHVLDVYCCTSNYWIIVTN